MMDRRTENQNTLAAALGVAAAEAAELLNISISVRFDPTDAAAARIAGRLGMLLRRTVRSVRTNPLSAGDGVEVAVGVVALQSSRSLRICVSTHAIAIGRDVPASEVPASTHPIICLAAAVYGAGAALRAAIPMLADVVPSLTSDPLLIPVSAVVGEDSSWLSRECSFADTYLAGAGAIGNGFVWALACLRVTGQLTIVDPDSVSDGNLNRCVLFKDPDIGRPKADQLAANAAVLFPALRLVPAVGTLQNLAKASTHDRWLRRLVVAVDSPRARRDLQGELPREVFDASTTGILECVFHHNIQPTDTACMACVYLESPDEMARERHTAEALGVDLSDVKSHYVSQLAAERIHARYPSVPMTAIVGHAYDSLFKALCSEAKLKTPEGRQVLAPFAFVSAMAGMYLAIETVRRIVLGSGGDSFNYWRLSPWAPPVLDLQQVRRRDPHCELCSRPAIIKAIRQLWQPS